MYLNLLQDLVKKKNDSKPEIHTTNNPAYDKLINQIIIIPEMIKPEQPPEPIIEEYQYSEDYEEDDMESQNIWKEMRNDFEDERKDSIDAWEEMIKERDKEKVTPKTIQEIPKTQEINKEEEWIQQKGKESLEEMKGKIEQEEKEV
jgi:hypothetical protein